MIGFGDEQEGEDLDHTVGDGDDPEDPAPA